MKPEHFLYKSDGLYYMQNVPEEPKYVINDGVHRPCVNYMFDLEYDTYSIALERAKAEAVKCDIKLEVKAVANAMVQGVIKSEKDWIEGKIYPINMEEAIDFFEEDVQLPSINVLGQGHQIKKGGGTLKMKFARIAAPKKEEESEDGISLIAKERTEQLTKHGRSVYLDFLQNSDGQLPDAASKLCVDDKGGYWSTELLPTGWDQVIWDKMTNKSYKERLIIAGALIAAEIDRILFIEKDDKIKRKPL